MQSSVTYFKPLLAKRETLILANNLYWVVVVNLPETRPGKEVIARFLPMYKRMPKLIFVSALTLVLIAQLGLAQVREKRVTPIDPQESHRIENSRKLGVAVLVGVGQYPAFGGLGGLRYATRDVDALANELTAQHYSVVKLNNSEAFGRAILNAISQAGELLDPEQGTLIFFFSGHGFAESGVNYLASFDAAANDLAHTGVSVNAVEEAMAKTGAKRRIMWIDACRNEPGKGVGDFRSFTRFAESSGTRVLFSTKAGRISYEDDQLQQGLFTYFLVKGLHGGASKDDGLISFRDLADFVSDQVGARSLQEGHVQVPYEAGESSGDFLIGRLPAETQIATPPPSPSIQRPQPSNGDGLNPSERDKAETAQFPLYHYARWPDNSSYGGVLVIGSGLVKWIESGRPSQSFNLSCSEIKGARQGTFFNDAYKYDFYIDIPGKKPHRFAANSPSEAVKIMHVVLSACGRS